MQLYIWTSKNKNRSIINTAKLDIPVHGKRRALGRLENLPHPLVPCPSCMVLIWIDDDNDDDGINIIQTNNMVNLLYILMAITVLKNPLREPVLELIESLRCRRKSWGPGQVLERWVLAQPWSSWVATQNQFAMNMNPWSLWIRDTIWRDHIYWSRM